MLSHLPLQKATTNRSAQQPGHYRQPKTLVTHMDDLPHPDHLAIDDPLHLARLRQCLAEADKAPKLPTNFRVGAILLNPSNNATLATGHTMELEGNTHAEQCCLEKIATSATPWPDDGVWLYTTVEPCVKRLSGAKSCVERILASCEEGRMILRVFVGVLEPGTFVQENNGKDILEKNGIQVIHITGLEDEILKVATAGHVTET